MAQIDYRANLSASVFPLISEDQGQTVIVPRYDNVFVPQIASQQDADKDRGIPQIYYCHNVIPYEHGFRSVGYIQRVKNTSAGNFIGQTKVRDSDHPDAILGYTSDGNFYVCLAGSDSWEFVTNIPTTDPVVSAAFVSGTTYVYIAGVGCYVFNFSGNTLDPVILNGLVASQILGILGVSGYLLAYSIDAIAWSSTVDPTDFVPSLITGAGGGQVEGARGPITFAIPVQLGFIVYTANNAVSALYSGNSRFPFSFREIVNSGGCSSARLVGTDSSAGSQIAYTTSGLQTVSPNQTNVILPAITEFISGRYFEDFDETDLEFTRTYLNNPMVKQLSVISDRYLLLSYGIESLTHSLMYDLVTKRMGKLKIDHVSVFEFPPLQTGGETPRESVAFLKSDGTIQIAEFANNLTPGNGVVIMGKYQFIRQRLLKLDTVDIENVKPWAEFNLYDLISVDGKNYRLQQMNLLSKNNLLRTYGANGVGKNHSLLFVGGFALSSLELHFHIHGNR